MSDKFISWFVSREKTQEIELIRKLARMTTETIEEFVISVHLAVESQIDEFQKSFRRIIDKEKEGDIMRKRIIEQIAKGEVKPDQRASLMRLVRQIDWIADWALESIRILSEFKIAQMGACMMNRAVEMSTAVRECAFLSEQCIKKLTEKNIDEALDAADRVERMEENVDELYQKSRSILANMETNQLSIGSIILLSEFLDAIESIADRCEDTCDQARVIAVTVSKPR